MMDEKGWIAREQILGEEARSRVPPEFQVQYPHFANPPTLLFALTRLMKQLETIHNLENNIQMGSQYENPQEALQILLEKQTKLSNMTELNIYLTRMYPKIKRRYQWFRNTQWGKLEWGRDQKATEAYRWRGRKDGHTLTSGIFSIIAASPIFTLFDSYHIYLHTVYRT